MMGERMTVECACEHGGDCTRTTVCATDSALADQADEYEGCIAALEQWGKDNQRLIDYVQDMGKPTFQAALKQVDGKT
jgi:hypothetical protein